MTDITLGIRFWQTQDAGHLADILARPQDGAINRENLTNRTGVHNDSGMQSFVENGSSRFVVDSINRAEMFAASHTLTEDEVELERVRSQSNARSLGVNVDELVERLANANADGTDRNDQAVFNEYKTSLKKAMNKLLATSEFTERAGRLQNLSEDGKLALCNATLGLASMLRSGSISENAVLYLADGKYYDASNSADLLRLVADSTKQVAETFVQSKELNDTIAECRRLCEHLPEGVADPERNELREQLRLLEQAKDELLQTRSRLVSTLKTDFLLSDPTGHEKSDAKFQRKQLHEMRCVLRAFRYDLDQAQGTFQNESVMTRFRRRLDNTFRSVGADVHRITAEEFQDAREKSTTYNDRLDNLKVKLMQIYGARNQAVPDGVGELHGNGMGEAADRAKELSHLTNDKIRYFFSNVEQNEAASAKQLQKSLDTMMKRGGKRKAAVEIGLDFLMGIDASFAKVKLKAGAKFVLDAEMAVPDGGGQLSVTYKYGGAGFAMGKAHFGANPLKNQNGFGADVNAEGEVGASRKITKTYANLDEFVRDTGGNSIALLSGIGGFFVDKAKKAARGIGKLGVKAATGLGLRIHKTHQDNVVYNAKLREFNVFGALDGVMLKYRNAVLTGRRKAVEIGGKGSVSGSGGFYSSTEKGESMASVDLNASVNGGYSRERFVQAKGYQKFAKSLADKSLNTLRANYSNELASLSAEGGLHSDASRAFLNELRAAVTVNARNSLNATGAALQSLLSIYVRMEGAAAGHDRKDVAFWEDFAKLTRLFIGANAYLAAEAKAMAGGEKLSASSNAFVAERLGNPAVRIPSAIFERYLLKTKNYGAPPKIVAHGGFSIGYSLVKQIGSGDKFTISPDEDVKSNWYGALALTGKTAGFSMENTVEAKAKEMAGLAHKVGANVTYEHPVLAEPDERPWVNDSSLTVDVNITASLTVRGLIEVIARAVVERKGGTDEMEKSMLLKEIKDEITGALVCGAGFAGMVALEPLLGMTVMDMIGRSEEFADFMKTLGVIPPKTKSSEESGPLSYDFGSTTDYFKTLRFKFDNWRFTGFSTLNTMNYSLTAGFNAFGPGMHFRYIGHTSDVDYAVLPTPSANVMLGRVSDLMGTGNPEALNHFLTRNKLGTIRLLHAAMNNQRDVDNDRKFAGDVEDIRVKLNYLEQHLEHIENEVRGDSLNEDAQNIHRMLTDARQHLQGMKERLQRGEEVLDSAKLDLAKELFTTMAMGFNLLQERKTV